VRCTVLVLVLGGSGGMRELCLRLLGDIAQVQARMQQYQAQRRMSYAGFLRIWMKNDGEKSAACCGSSSTLAFKTSRRRVALTRPRSMRSLGGEDIGVYKVILKGGNSDDGNNSNASLGSPVVHCNCSSCGFFAFSAKLRGLECRKFEFITASLEAIISPA
jgi:hypothetical protein